MDQTNQRFDQQQQQRISRPGVNVNMPSLGDVQRDSLNPQQNQGFMTRQQNSFVSTFAQDQQRPPVSSLFVTQTRQQNDLPPVVTSFSFSSPNIQQQQQQRPFVAQPIQQKSNDGGQSGW